MEILQHYFEYEFKYHYLVRNIVLSPNTILSGPPKSGKTYLALDYAMESKKRFLYLDFDDTRVAQVEMKTITGFVQSNNIALVILDNYHATWDESICEYIIISNLAKQPLAKYQTLGLLTFEEYIIFNKTTNLKQLFNLFLRHDHPFFGHKYSLLEEIAYQNGLKHHCKTEATYAVLLECVKNQGKEVSLFAIFNNLKETKISKDTFYKTIESFNTQHLLHWLGEYKKENSKKLYLYDFALSSKLLNQKEFSKQFENMVFLELQTQYNDLCFYQAIPFVSPANHVAFVTVPFLNDDSFLDKSDALYKVAKKLGIKHLFFITIDFEDRLDINEIHFSAVAFWSWAIGEES